MEGTLAAIPITLGHHREASSAVGDVPGAAAVATNNGEGEAESEEQGSEGYRFRFMGLVRTWSLHRANEPSYQYAL